MDSKKLTQAKAKEMLHNPPHGRPLTDKQRKYFGAVASGWLDRYRAGGHFLGTTNQGFNYNGAWGGTMQMGGSFPGATGMMYARTGGMDYDLDSYEAGGGIPERYKNMGFTKTGVKKKSNRPGKKWMVLAKKGDQYKVVHGGYKGMQDFTQHGSEKRRKNFWNRMGGKNSSKATNPFSPLYWHKRFGTWEAGGKIDYSPEFGYEQTMPIAKNGYSIVDYLNSRGYKSDKSFRQQLAKEYGVENYDFSADKNLELLSLLAEDEARLKNFSGNKQPRSSSKTPANNVKRKILTDLMMAPFSSPAVYSGLNVQSPNLAAALHRNVPAASPKEEYVAPAVIDVNPSAFSFGQPIDMSEQPVYDQIPTPSSVIRKTAPANKPQQTSWYQNIGPAFMEAFRNSGLDWSGVGFSPSGGTGLPANQTLLELPEYVGGLVGGLGRKLESMQEEDKRAIKKTSKGLSAPKTTSKNKEAIPSVPYGYEELYTVPDVRNPKDSLVSFTNIFDNETGGRYYIGHKAKEVTDAGAQKTFGNSRAVAHFLRDSDILPNQKFAPESWVISKGYKFNTTSPGKAVSASGLNNPERYRMLYRPNPNNDGTYQVKYVRNKELSKEDLQTLSNSGWGTDFTVSAQHKFSDIDWGKEGPSTGYAAQSKWVPLKTGEHTYIPYKNKDAFSRFSGGSGVYLFTEPKSGKRIGIDVSGSVNTLKKVGEDIVKKYNIKPNELELLYHDMGSYSAKPKAKGDVLDYDQWLDYNTYNRGFSGAPLIIPKKKLGGKVMSYYQQGLDFQPKTISKNGSTIKKDNMGYWNPENWGQPVEIDSNVITMDGVYQPLLGVSDTGDTQMMYPGEDYVFDGESVTEYPMMKKGGKLANKKASGRSNWLDKYK